MWLRADLKIADKIRQTKERIYQQLSNEALFDEQISQHFKESTAHKRKYRFSEEEQGGQLSQVQLMMKVLTILDEAEEEMAAIEQANLTSWTVTIGAKLGYKLTTTVDRFYNLIELVNNSPSELQPFLEPITTSLLPKLSEALPNMTQVAEATKGMPGMSQVAELADIRSIEDAGELSAKAINALPQSAKTEQQMRSELIEQAFQLPEYFEKIGQQLNINTGQPVDKAALAAKKQKAQKEIGNFLESTWFGSRLWHAPSACRSIAAIYKELLLETGQPLTKEGYLRASKKLNQLRHNTIPELMAEVDKIERTLGLKPGAISDKLLESIESSYQQLCQHVNMAVTLSGAVAEVDKLPSSWLGGVALNLVGIGKDNVAVEPSQLLSDKDIIKDLDVLQDGEFVQRRLIDSGNQKVEIKEQQQALSHAKTSAAEFFRLIKAAHQSNRLGKLRNVSAEEKIKLSIAYKDIQTLVANESPTENERIVEALTLTVEDRTQIIKEAGLTTTQKNELADALRKSAKAVDAYIEKLVLDDEVKAQLRYALSDPKAREYEFAESVRTIPDSSASGVFAMAKAGLGVVWAFMEEYSYHQMRNDNINAQFVSGLVGTDGQVESIDDFERVTKLADKVQSKIDTLIRDQKFKADQLSSQSELAYQQAATASASLVISKTEKPFAILDDTRGLKNLTEQESLHQWMLFSNQQDKLLAFEKTYQTFVEKCNDYSGSQKIAELTPSQRQELINIFKQLQPFVAAIDPVGRVQEESMIACLAEGTTATIHGLKLYHQQISTVLSESIAKGYEQTHDLMLAYENKRSDNLLSKPLSLQPHQEDKPLKLFEMVSAQKLPEKIAKFKTQTLLPALKAKLSPALLKKLDLDNVTYPITSFHGDSQTEASYKRLLNTLYYLEQGFNNIDQLAEIGDNPSYYQKAIYLNNSVNNMIVNLYSSYYYLNEIRQQPHLNALASEMLELFKPIQSIPVVGHYLSMAKEAAANNSSMHIVEPQNQQSLLEVWDEQMAVVADCLQTSAPTKLYQPSVARAQQARPVNVSQQVAQPVKAQADYLQSFSEAFYQLKFNLKVQQKGGIENLSQQEIKQLQLEATKQAKALQSKFSETLGYTNFLKVPHDYLEGAIKVITDLNNVAHLGRDVVFSRLQDVPDKMLLSMLQASDSAEVTLGLKQGEVSEPVLDSFNRFYMGLLASLDFSNEDQQLARIGVDNEVINQRVAYLENKQQALSSSSQAEDLKDDIASAFSEIKSLVDDKCGFKDDATGQDQRRAFLNAYQKLQPYLFQIDYRLDRKYFIRDLQKAEDFKAASEQIVKLKPDLDLLHKSSERTLTQQADFCKENLKAIYEKKSAFKQDVDSARFNKFKDRLLNAEIKQRKGTVLKEVDSKAIYFPMIERAVFKKFNSHVSLAELKMEAGLKRSIKEKCDAAQDEIIHDVSAMEVALMPLAGFAQSLTTFAQSASEGDKNIFNMVIAQGAASAKEKIEHFLRQDDYQEGQLIALYQELNSVTKRIESLKDDALAYAEINWRMTDVSQAMVNDLSNPIEKSYYNEIAAFNKQHAQMLLANNVSDEALSDFLEWGQHLANKQSFIREYAHRYKLVSDFFNESKQRLEPNSNNPYIVEQVLEVEEALKLIKSINGVEPVNQEVLAEKLKQLEARMSTMKALARQAKAYEVFAGLDNGILDPNTPLNQLLAEIEKNAELFKSLDGVDYLELVYDAYSRQMAEDFIAQSAYPAAFHDKIKLFIINELNAEKESILSQASHKVGSAAKVEPKERMKCCQQLINEKVGHIKIANAPVIKSLKLLKILKSDLDNAAQEKIVAPAGTVAGVKQAYVNQARLEIEALFKGDDITYFKQEVVACAKKYSQAKRNLSALSEAQKILAMLDEAMLSTVNAHLHASFTLPQMQAHFEPNGQKLAGMSHAMETKLQLLMNLRAKLTDIDEHKINNAANIVAEFKSEFHANRDVILTVKGGGFWHALVAFIFGDDTANQWFYKDEYEAVGNLQNSTQRMFESFEQAPQPKSRQAHDIEEDLIDGEALLADADRPTIEAQPSDQAALTAGKKVEEKEDGNEADTPQARNPR